MLEELPKGVFCGNSVAFGMGLSGDYLTIPSQLNKNQLRKILWYNFSIIGGASISQERVVIDAYAPLSAKYYVTLSGCIDIFLSMVGRQGMNGQLPFFGESIFNLLLKQTEQESSYENREICFDKMINLLKRELALLSMRWKGSRILYCLQPIYPWTKKITMTEEKKLLDSYYKMYGDISIGYSRDIIGNYHDRFSNELNIMCKKLNLSYIDLNEDPVINGNDWIFLDPVHLTDIGHTQISRRIMDWIKTF